MGGSLLPQLRSGDRFLLYCSGWSAMVKSWLTEAFASWVQAILPPQPPSGWHYSCAPPHLANFFSVKPHAFYPNAFAPAIPSGKDC
ncbi:putative uncharacterized protein SPANXA2-OT1 [Plecturocebus cupreus]